MKWDSILRAKSYVPAAGCTCGFSRGCPVVNVWPRLKPQVHKTRIG